MHDAPSSPSFKHGLPPNPAQPYLDWARATDFSYLREGRWLPLLVEFNPDELPKHRRLTPLQVFATRKWLDDDPHSLDEEFIVPEVFSKLPRVLQNCRSLTFCVVLMRRSEGVLLKLTSRDAWKRTILSAHLGPPFNVPPAPTSPMSLTSASTPPSPGAIPPAPAVPPPAQKTASTSQCSADGPALPIKRVIVAVIDQGIAFANSHFELGATTRIEYLWQQDFLGSAPPPFGTVMGNTTGVELNRSDINYAKSEARKIGAGDEWIYRNFGGLDFSVDGFKPLARRSAHGTHVLNLAAANEAPAQHPIIAVDMPEDGVGDPAGSTLFVHAAWGLIYILSRAELLWSKTETLPIVANLSYGPHEGPHDGNGEFERFMDQIVQACDGTVTPLAIVLAAGNSRQSRTHAQAHVPARRTTKLVWRLQPGGLTPSMMEVWLPPGAGTNVTITLRPPKGSPISVSATKLNDAVPPGAPNGSALYWAQYIDQTTLPGSQTTLRARVVLSVARTAMDPASTWGDVVAPSGPWQVEIKSKHAIDVQAWIKRSDTLPGRRAKGRQSYFDDPQYKEQMESGRSWDYDESSAASYIRRMRTFSGIATGQQTFVIGGYCEADGYPAPYSSHGSRKLGGLDCGPNWLERSDDTVVCRGVLASGTMSGSTIAMNGSSVSAPQAARAIADEWRKTQKVPAYPPKLLPGVVDPERPIPAGEVAFAFGGGLAPSEPYAIFGKR